jgi:4-hydroxy-3-methylbut-2-enyl diphosphate reductase
MVVIGGFNSSNTNKLADICRQACNKVIRCENADDIDLASLNGCETIGVTAGASTPEQIILEVINRMENAAEKLEKSLDDFKTLKVGDIVTGEIIAVNDNEVYLNIGYKSDGVIKKSDFLMDLYSELTSIAAVGDKVEAMIIDTNDGTGNVSLSKLKVDEIAAQKEIEAKYESKETIHGKIIKIVKGGVMVDIGFTKAFMPGNQYASDMWKTSIRFWEKKSTAASLSMTRARTRSSFPERLSSRNSLPPERTKKPASRPKPSPR